MATTLLESGPSLEEILSRYQLTETSLDNYCSHDIRNEIAVRLDDWEMIGYGLGFPRDKLRSIRRENDTEDLRKIALLDTWSRREGKGATYLKLARVLHVRQRCDLVELLCARFVSTRPEDGTRLSHTIDCCGPQVTGRDVPKKIKELEERFRKLHGELLSILIEDKISTDSVLQSLTLLPIDLKGRYESKIQELLPTLEAKERIHALFRYLNPLFTFIDYDLLRHLISTFGKTELKEDMATYADQVKLFKQETTVGDLIAYWPGCCITESDVKMTYKPATLRAKIGDDPKTYTLEKLDSFRNIFCCKIFLSDYVSLFILEILEAAGSFWVVWRIPFYDELDLEEAKFLSPQFYQSEHVQELSLDGLTLYSIFATQSVSPSSGMPVDSSIVTVHVSEMIHTFSESSVESIPKSASKLPAVTEREESNIRRRHVTTNEGSTPSSSSTKSSGTENISTWIHLLRKLSKVLPTKFCFTALLILLVSGVIFMALSLGREVDYKSTKPSMKELTNLDDVHIIERIGVDYRDIATELVNDIHGTILPAIEKDQLGKTDEIIATIFRRWLAGKGRQPVTWQTLVDVLRDTAKLHNLADDIVSALEARDS